jgi:hypothetical protein
MEIIINIIKKLFKYLFILIIIGGIIGGGAYFWQENENKKEAELNLAFFTTDIYDGSLTKGVKWSPVSTWYSNNNAEANYQYGYKSESGQMFFREVRRDAIPPVVATYYLYKDSEDSSHNLGVTAYWIVDCPPDSSEEYSYDDNESNFLLKCTENGKYLYSTTGWDETDITNGHFDALGFYYKVNTSPFNMTEIKQNATLIKLKSEDI